MGRCRRATARCCTDRRRGATSSPVGPTSISSSWQRHCRRTFFEVWVAVSANGGSQRANRHSSSREPNGTGPVMSSPSRSPTCAPLTALLRGANPLDGVQVSPSDLRAALERELRGKLLRLRQGYAARSSDQSALGALAARSSSTVLVLLRGVLSLEVAPHSLGPTATGLRGICDDGHRGRGVSGRRASSRRSEMAV